MEKRIYTPEQKERKRLYDIQYREKNKEKRKEKIKVYREKNKDKIKESQKQYTLNNKDKKKEYDKIYREQNKEDKKKRDKEYYNKNKEKLKKHVKSYREKNKEIINKRTLDKKKNDSLFKLTCNTRSLIKQSFKRKGCEKLTKTEIILGCTFKQFKSYIESKFESWMNWENYGNWNGIPSELNTAWDIDHIIPLSTAKTEEDVIRLNHHSNLQPLCSYINRFIKKDII